MEEEREEYYDRERGGRVGRREEEQGVKAGEKSPGSYQQNNSSWGYSRINHQLAPSLAFPTCQLVPQMLTFSRGLWPQSLLTSKSS